MMMMGHNSNILIWPTKSGKLHCSRCRIKSDNRHEQREKRKEKMKPFGEIDYPKAEAFWSCLYFSNDKTFLVKLNFYLQDGLIRG